MSAASESEGTGGGDTSKQSRGFIAKSASESEGTGQRKKRKTTGPSTKDEEAGLHFSTEHIFQRLQQQKISENIGSGATVYLSAVLQNLTQHVLRLAGDVSRSTPDPKNGKFIIDPKHIFESFQNSDNLRALTKSLKKGDAATMFCSLEPKYEHLLGLCVSV